MIDHLPAQTIALFDIVLHTLCHTHEDTHWSTTVMGLQMEDGSGDVRDQMESRIMVRSRSVILTEMQDEGEQNL